MSSLDLGSLDLVLFHRDCSVLYGMSTGCPLPLSLLLLSHVRCALGPASSSRTRKRTGSQTGTIIVLYTTHRCCGIYCCSTCSTTAGSTRWCYRYSSKKSNARALFSPTPSLSRMKTFSPPFFAMHTFFLGAAAAGLSLLKIATADEWTDAIFGGLQGPSNASLQLCRRRHRRVVDKVAVVHCLELVVH